MTGKYPLRAQRCVPGDVARGTVDRVEWRLGVAPPNAVWHRPASTLYQLGVLSPTPRRQLHQLLPRSGVGVKEPEGFQKGFSGDGNVSIKSESTMVQPSGYN